MALIPASNPLFVDTVMVNVLSYLPREDFFSSRLACKDWDKNGRHLIKNDKCKFDLGIRLYRISALSDEKFLRFAEFCSLFADDPDGKKMVYSKFQMPDFVFVRQFTSSQRIRLSPSASSSVDEFFTKFGDKITTLKLLFAHKPEFDTKKNSDCMARLRNLERAALLMPNLQRIEFVGYLKIDEHNWSDLEVLRKDGGGKLKEQDPIQPQPQFHHVTRMTLCLTRFNSPILRLPNLPQLFPNLRWLCITNQERHMVNSLLQDSFESYYTNPNHPLPCHIETLILQDIYLKDLAILKRLSLENGLRLKCFIGAIPDSNEKLLLQGLCEFFELQKESLERLDLAINPLVLEMSESEANTHSPFVMPKLKSLRAPSIFIIKKLCKPAGNFYAMFPSIEKLIISLGPFANPELHQDFQLFRKMFDSQADKNKITELEWTMNRKDLIQMEEMPYLFPNVSVLTLNFDTMKTSLIGDCLKILFEQACWRRSLKILRLGFKEQSNGAYYLYEPKITGIDTALLGLGQYESTLKFIKYVGSDQTRREKEKEKFGISKLKNLNLLELSGHASINDMSVYLGFGRMKSLKEVRITSPAIFDFTPRCKMLIEKKELLMTKRDEMNYDVESQGFIQLGIREAYGSEDGGSIMEDSDDDMEDMEDSSDDEILLVN